jgi:hypothetical protein
LSLEVPDGHRNPFKYGPLIVWRSGQTVPSWRQDRQKLAAARVQEFYDTALFNVS